MGFITNQWLKGSAARNRGHYPVGVSLKVQGTSDTWAESKMVICTLQAKKEDGNYQTLYFSAKDLQEILPALTQYADADGLKDTAYAAMRRLKDSALVEALKFSLLRRI